MKKDKKGVITPLLLVDDLYREGLKTLATIQNTIAEKKLVPDQRISEAVRYRREHFIENNVPAHEDWTEENRLGYLPQEKSAIERFSKENDDITAKEIKLIKQSMVPAVEESKSKWSFLKLGFLNSAKKVDAGTLFTQEEEMRGVMRLIRTVKHGYAAQQDGEEGNTPNQRGYITPQLLALKDTPMPKTHEEWLAVGKQLLKATNPKFLDECVVHTLDEHDRSDHATGYAVIAYTGNDIGVLVKPQFGIFEKHYYSSEIGPVTDDYESVSKTFSALLSAKTGADVCRALGEEVDPDKTYGKVRPRHTRVGNFIGGAVGSDLYHSNPAVVEAAKLQQEM